MEELSKLAAESLSRPKMVSHCKETQMKSTVGLYQCGCWLSLFAILWFLHHLSCCMSEEQSPSFAPSLSDTSISTSAEKRW